MNNIKDRAKYAAGSVNCFLWKTLSVFIPKNPKRIMFDSFLGKQYSCNPRAIYEYLLRNTDDLEFVWAFKDFEDKPKLLNNKKTIKCRYRSFKHYYYMITSGCVIYNWKIPYDMPVRKNQVLIQTWHGGGCYKTAGTEIKENSDFRSRRMIEEINRATYYISSSKYFSDKVIREQNKYKGHILPVGMPRNDIFFKKNKSAASIIRKSLNISDSEYVVLYAPTYRESMMSDSFEELNCQKLKSIISEKTGKNVTVLYRGHHYNSKNSSGNFDKDVSNYYDMQNLLLISDMLISDYSSSIWDFSFTYKPCLLYTPDLKEYEEARGFDEDIHTWGFPMCVSNDILCDTVKNYDAQIHKSNMEEHHKSLGSFEKGNATKKVCELIIKEIKRRSK